MATASNSPGWYPDPDGRPGERWWNGAGWSDARRGAGAPTPPVAPPLPPTMMAAPRAATPPAAPPATPAYGAPSAATPPPVYSASNPAPQYPGQFVAPGAPGYTPRSTAGVDARQNPMALYSFIAGLASIFINILLVPSILAIVFYRKARERSLQLAAAGQADGSKGLAVGGLVTGIVGLIFGLFNALFLVAGFLPLFFFDYSTAP